MCVSGRGRGMPQRDFTQGAKWSSSTTDSTPWTFSEGLLKKYCKLVLTSIFFILDTQLEVETLPLQLEGHLINILPQT